MSRRATYGDDSTLIVACPDCHAKDGERCRSTGKRGRRLGQPHAARERAHRRFRVELVARLRGAQADMFDAAEPNPRELAP